MKKPTYEKPKESNKEDQQRPKAHVRAFAMTQKDVQATSDVVIGNIHVFYSFATALIDPSSTYFLVVLLLLWNLV